MWTIAVSNCNLQPVEKALLEGLALALIDDDTLVVPEEHPAEAEELLHRLTIDQVFSRDRQSFELWRVRKGSICKSGEYSHFGKFRYI